MQIDLETMIKEVEMEKGRYSSTRKSETIELSKVEKPTIGRYEKNSEGKLVFVENEKKTD